MNSGVNEYPDHDAKLWAKWLRATGVNNGHGYRVPEEVWNAVWQGNWPIDEGSIRWILEEYLDVETAKAHGYLELVIPLREQAEAALNTAENNLEHQRQIKIDADIANKNSDVIDDAVNHTDVETPERLSSSPGGPFSRLASAGKAIGSWVVGVAILAVIVVSIVSGGKLAASVQPWVETFAGVCLLVSLPISIVLLLFRSSRGYGGLGLYLASFPVGFSLWVTCFVYALSVSIFWTVAGLLLGGLGVVPIAAIMTLVRKDWSSLGVIVGTVLVVWLLRGVGAWITEKADEWKAAALSRVDVTREFPPKRSNYFVRHWRGQFSLGVSYWVNGFLATFIVGTLAALVASIQTDLKTHSLLVLLVFALAIVASIWQGVGVWRSASHHFPRGGTHFWAGVAKLMVIIGFLSTSGLIWQSYIPQVAELLSIIAGDTGIPAYQIQVLPGGTEIEFRGGLRAGSAKELERIFSAVPRAKVLHIESPGGRIGEATQMMQLVRQRNLTTYTSEYCMSAATLVLIAGKERVIAATAKVGFHAGSFPGLTPEQQREMDHLIRSTMHSAGVSDRFTERVIATPGDQMWYPSFGEMQMNGVVTSQSYGERFASSISDTDLDAMSEKLSALPLFRTIREFEPEAYTKMMSDFSTAIRAGKSEGEAVVLVRQTAETVTKKYLEAASDETLMAVLWDDWIALLKNYKDTNSQACIAALGAPDARIELGSSLPDFVTSNRARIHEKVMRSGASKKPFPIDRKAAGDDLDGIFNGLRASYGNDLQLLNEPNKWMENSHKACDMLLVFYERIAALPQRRAANVVRYLTVDTESRAGEPQHGVTYRVAKIKPGEVLNLRSGPGSNYPVLMAIPAGTRGITLGEGHVANGATMWQEVFINGHTGWVNEIYIEIEAEIRKAKPVTRMVEPTR